MERTRAQKHRQGKSGVGKAEWEKREEIECRPCNLQLLPQSIAAAQKPPTQKKKGPPFGRGFHFVRMEMWIPLYFFFTTFFYASIAKKSPTGRSWSAKPLFPPLTHTHTHTRWKSAKENVNEKSVLLGWKRGL